MNTDIYYDLDKAIEDIQNMLNHHFKPSREFSLVLTKLDEAQMWLNAIPLNTLREEDE